MRMISFPATFVLLAMIVSPGIGRAEHSQRALLTALAAEIDVHVCDLELTASSRLDLPLTGVTLYRVKAVNLITGEIHASAVDETGSPADVDAALARERAVHKMRFRNLDPELLTRLESMNPEEEMTVGVWMRTDPATSWTLNRPALSAAGTPLTLSQSVAAAEAKPGLGSEGEPFEKVRGETPPALAERLAEIHARNEELRTEHEVVRALNRIELEQRIAELQAPLLEQLALNGHEPVYVSPHAPLVYVRLTKAQILDLAERTDIDRIYPPYIYADLMDVARVTQKADWVDDVFGFDGTGEDVAILEDSRVEFANPYLIAGSTRVPGDPNVDDHATACAGIVANQHATYQGISTGAYLLSANATTYSDANLSAAMDWASGGIPVEVEIINNSWGGNEGTTTLNVHDRHLDWIVRNSWETVTVSAGNEAGPCGSGNARVTSPARAFNVISVGNYDDGGTTTWDDDAMDICSSYVDPSSTHGDREKPELAASGSFITSTTALSPWIANVGSGTSYSAPMVAGSSALLMQRQTALELLPESTKAVLMATALHNIEGNSRLSELDGAGGVDMRAAFSLVDRGWVGGSTVTTANFPFLYYANLYAGETARAAIVWHSNPAGDYSTDPLDADLDLAVKDPAGGTVAYSTSWDNSYEIVEFVPATTGVYEFSISNIRFDGASEYLGYTFWQANVPLTPYFPQTHSTPPVSRRSYRAEAGIYWNAVGIRPPIGADYDIELFDESPFGDPDDHVSLGDSIIGGSNLDFVVIDCHHAPVKGYFPMVHEYSGTGGNYNVELATHTGDDGSLGGTYGPFGMTSSQLLRVWSSYLANGTRKYYAVEPISGDADLGLALFVSDSGSPATWVQGRVGAVAIADTAPGGGAEYIDYLPAANDWAGLVVFNNGANVAGDFMLYADTTAPTGSVLINGGAAATSSLGVTLTLSASDPQTGAPWVRLSNDGTTWTAWEPRQPSRSWTLVSGPPGLRTVYVQYRNAAGMVSGSYTDTIEFIEPLGLIFSDGFESGDTSAWSQTFP